MGLRIKAIDIDAGRTLSPQCFQLLDSLWQHKNVCRECEIFMKTRQGAYCDQGREFVDRLIHQPEVEFFED